MNSYEILIHNMEDDTEMNAVQDALFTAGIPGADEDGIGLYLHDNKPRSVFVEPGFVGFAVEVLNGLGYETDEDEVEDVE